MDRYKREFFDNYWEHVWLPSPAGHFWNMVKSLWVIHATIIQELADRWEQDTSVKECEIQYFENPFTDKEITEALHIWKSERYRVMESLEIYWESIVWADSPCLDSSTYPTLELFLEDKIKIINYFVEWMLGRKISDNLKLLYSFAEAMWEIIALEHYKMDKNLIKKVKLYESNISLLFSYYNPSISRDNLKDIQSDLQGIWKYSKMRNITAGDTWLQGRWLQIWWVYEVLPVGYYGKELDMRVHKTIFTLIGILFKLDREYIQSVIWEDIGKTVIFTARANVSKHIKGILDDSYYDDDTPELSRSKMKELETNIDIPKIIIEQMIEAIVTLWQAVTQLLWSKLGDIEDYDDAMRHIFNKDSRYWTIINQVALFAPPATLLWPASRLWMIFQSPIELNNDWLNAKLTQETIAYFRSRSSEIKQHMIDYSMPAVWHWCPFAITKNSNESSIVDRLWELFYKIYQTTTI